MNLLWLSAESIPLHPSDQTFVSYAHCKFVAGCALVTSRSAKCFFQLRQPHSVRRSLDDDFVATLVYTLVAIRVDYCVGLYWPRLRDNRQVATHPQRSCVGRISNRGKYDRRLAHVCRHVLHRHDVNWPDPVQAVRPGVQVSAQHGSQISGRALQTCLKHRRSLAASA